MVLLSTDLAHLGRGSQKGREGPKLQGSMLLCAQNWAQYSQGADDFK